MIIKNVQSNFIFDFGILIFVKQSAVPNTRPKFAMLEPITLEIAMSAEPLSAELILISNSGAEVANDTTVKPITTLDKFSLIDRSTADFKR